MRGIVPLGTLACILLFSNLHAAAATAGNAVLVKSGSDALVLWDATQPVTEIVLQKKPRVQALRALEAQAVGIGESKVAAGARTIAVRVIYARTGAVSPVYNAATFASVEKLATITMPAKPLKTLSRKWAQMFKDGKTPAGVTLRVTGALPPL